MGVRKPNFMTYNKILLINGDTYCNQPKIFKKMSFEQFIVKRTNNIVRQEKSLKLWSSNK